MSYRDDVAALAARHDALAAELAEKTRELDKSHTMLEQARARARLPVLDQVQIASPCTADWERMTGDHQVRHCGDCRKDVYNLSGMTHDEAEALILGHHGELCVRYYQRHDGTILLSDCTVGVDRLRRRKKTAARAAMLVAGGLVVAGATAASQVTMMGRMAPPEESHVVMGQVPRFTPPVQNAPPVPDVPPAQDVTSPEQRFAQPPAATDQAAEDHLRKAFKEDAGRGQVLVGAMRALTWDAPAQADAKPARHPAGGAGKRAR